MAVLDAPDRVILDVLRRDGRATVAELASATGLSASACSRRLRRLEDQKVIRGYRAIIDPAADGRGLTAFVAVRLVRHQREHIQRFQEGVRKIAAFTSEAAPLDSVEQYVERALSFNPRRNHREPIGLEKGRSWRTH